MPDPTLHRSILRAVDELAPELIAFLQQMVRTPSLPDVDVVSPGDERLWASSPWSGDVIDGKLYGRGSCDMKAGVSAGIFALAALRRLGLSVNLERDFDSNSWLSIYG